jgi:hypothetical protein
MAVNSEAAEAMTAAYSIAKLPSGVNRDNLE